MHKLLEVISASLNSTNEKFIIDKDLFLMAKKSHMEVFFENTTDPKTDDKIKSAIKKSIFSEISRDQRQKEEKDIIVKLFNDNKINFIFLKGFSLKQYYPKTYYRFMCDMDILVQEKDLRKATKLLKSIGYIKEHESDHDYVFKKEPIFNIELHFLLIPDNKEGKKYFIPPFKRLSPITDDTYEMKFTKLEDELIFNFFHTLKHYECSGIGIRNFLDLYLFIKNNPSLDFDYIHKAYTYTKYEKDCYELENFIFNLFKDENNVDLINEVINDGTYGTQKKHYINESKGNNSTLLFILRKAFPSYSKMKILYPFVRHWYFVILLPFCYLHRIIKFTLFKPNQAKDKINYYKNNCK